MNCLKSSLFMINIKHYKNFVAFNGRCIMIYHSIEMTHIFINKQKFLEDFMYLHPQISDGQKFCKENSWGFQLYKLYLLELLSKRHFINWTLNSAGERWLVYAGQYAYSEKCKTKSQCSQIQFRIEYERQRGLSAEISHQYTKIKS